MGHEKEIIEKHLFSDTSRYEDIMKLPRHQSKAHLPMSRHDRAGQFAPFSALTGYHQLIDQTAHHYRHKQYLTKQQVAVLQHQFRQLSKQTLVEVNYFNAHSGYYETIQTTFMKIDWLAGKACFIDYQDGKKHSEIPLANIKSIRNLPQNHH